MPEELMELLWLSNEKPEFAAKGYRCYPLTFSGISVYVILWADNNVGDDIQYIGNWEDPEKALNGLIDYITGGIQVEVGYVIIGTLIIIWVVMFLIVIFGKEIK